MLKISKISTAIALLITAASSFAVVQPTGIYVGANGSYEAYDNNGTSTTGISNNKAFGFGGTIGYQYAFTQNFALGAEVGYQNFGKNSYTNPNLFGSTTITNKGYQFFAVGSYLWNNGVNVFAKVGAAEINTDMNLTLIGGSVNTWQPATAVGIGYMPVQNLNVYMQYEYIYGDNWGGNNVTVNGSAVTFPGEAMSQQVLSLGLTYTFPMN